MTNTPQQQKPLFGISNKLNIVTIISRADTDWLEHRGATRFHILFIRFSYTLPLTPIKSIIFILLP